MSRRLPVLLSLALLAAWAPPQSAEPLKIDKQARIVLLGNGLGSRMIHYGHFDTELHLRYPEHELFIRNMCDEGNTPSFRPHSARKSQIGFPGAEKFAMAARIDSVHVPFKNAVDAVTATVTGQIDWLVAAPVGAVTEWIRTQRLVALAVTAPTRFPALPDVPTLAQSGISGADSTIWAGLFVSSRSPREIIARLNSATLAALQSKVAQAQLHNLGAESQPLTPEEFDAMVLREYESARDVAKAARISVK